MMRKLLSILLLLSPSILAQGPTPAEIEEMEAGLAAWRELASNPQSIPDEERIPKLATGLNKTAHGRIFRIDARLEVHRELQKALLGIRGQLPQRVCPGFHAPLRQRRRREIPAPAGWQAGIVSEKGRVPPLGRKRRPPVLSGPSRMDGIFEAPDDESFRAFIRFIPSILVPKPIMRRKALRLLPDGGAFGWAGRADRCWSAIPMTQARVMPGNHAKRVDSSTTGLADCDMLASDFLAGRMLLDARQSLS